MQDVEGLRRDLEEAVADLSPDARGVWDEVKEAARRYAHEEDAGDPEPPPEFDNLSKPEQDALFRTLRLSAELHAALMHQAKGVITRAQELEPSIGENATLEEAIAALERHGVSPGISPELADMVVKVPTTETRTVPSYYPDFADANKIRSWDGSEQAEAWARLMDYRDECISASVGKMADMGFENIDYAGLIAFLWAIGEDEVEEIVRRRLEERG